MTDALIQAIHGVVGDKGLIRETGDMEPYLVEERGLFCGSALCVVRPANTQECADVVKLCADAGIAVVPQGGNTGLCGGGVPDGAVILTTSRMNQIRAVDPVNLTMTVDAGCILKTIQEAADDADALFPLSLGAEGTCQIGGNLSTNAGGNAVLRYGNTRDLVLGLEVVLADGRIWNGLRQLRKDNTGYDLKHLFMGAEGTLGIITAAVLKLFPKPKTKVTALCAAESVDDILKLFTRAKASFGDTLTAYEFLSRRCMEFAVKNVEGCKDPFEAPYAEYALIQLTSPRADENLNDALEAVLGEAFEEEVVVDAVIAQSEAQADDIWHIRESIPEAQKHEGGSIKHDISVPVSSVPKFIKQGSALVEERIPGIRVCAFGHLGDGNIHFNLSQPEGADTQAYLDRWHEVNGWIHDLVATMNGSFSAEHGIGKLKVEDMARYKQPVELELMRSVKQALDPKGIMNPGKVVG